MATRAFRVGETIVAERPLVAVPMPGSAATLSCHHCLAFIGDEQTHLDLTAGRVGLAQAASRERVRHRCTGCGVLYCSARCQQASLARGHALLCASGEAAAAWRRFRSHAQEDAELPELEIAANLLAVVLLRSTTTAVAASASEELAAAAVALGFAQEPIRRVLLRDAAGAAAAAQTLREVRKSCRLLREALLLSCESAGVSAHSVRTHARMRGDNSFGNLVGLAFLNQVAVVVPHPAHARIESMLSGVDGSHSEAEGGAANDGSDGGGGDTRRSSAEHAALTAMLPYAQQAALAAQQKPSGGTGDASAAAARLTVGDLVDNAGQLFPPLDCTGLSWLVCMMNHSCDPNAVVSYATDDEHGIIGDHGTRAPRLPRPRRRPPVRARIVAQRPIAIGEEIVHPYVDAGESRAQRREGLAIYGIRCECVRCMTTE